VTVRRRNHWIWIGLALTLGGAITYFTWFARFPALRDVPWVNLPLVLIGVLLSGAAVWRAFARPHVFRGKILGSIGLSLSLLVGALFCAYIFFLSYRMPAPTAVTLGLSEVGDFRLLDQDGRVFHLSDLRGRKVVLTFYRGHW
jgi:hypothetical protein